MSEPTNTMNTPEITALEPDSASKDSGQFVLGIKGKGFTMHSQVCFDGQGVATGMLGQDLLSAPLDPALYDEAGVIDVTVKTGDHVTPPIQFTLKPET